MKEFKQNHRYIYFHAGRIAWHKYESVWRTWNDFGNTVSIILNSGVLSSNNATITAADSWKRRINRVNKTSTDTLFTEIFEQINSRHREEMRGGGREGGRVNQNTKTNLSNFHAFWFSRPRYDPWNGKSRFWHKVKVTKQTHIRLIILCPGSDSAVI